MARLAFASGPGGYVSLRINAATTAVQALTSLIDCNSATAVAAPGSATIAVTANVIPNAPYINTLDGIRVGMPLAITDGTGTAEVVQVTAFSFTNAGHTTGTITAVFANTHSGTYNIRSLNGGELGPLMVMGSGTAMTLALYDGHPSLASGHGAGRVIEQHLTASGNGQWALSSIARYGVFYAYTGTTAGDLTLQFRLHAY